MSTEQDIVNLINEANTLEREVTLTNVTIHTPIPLSDTTIPGLNGRNSSIKVDGVNNQGYKGTTEVYVTRGELPTLFSGIRPVVRDRSFTAQRIIDEINGKYGLSLELTDFEPWVVPVFETEELEQKQSIVLSVKDGNWYWVGSVTVDVIYGNPELEYAVLVQLMPVLEHPDDPNVLSSGQRSGQLCTYAFDFTKWKKSLQIDPATGLWSDFKTVLEIGRKAGLGNWSNGYVVDLSTADYPLANPDFERVMIQQYTRGDVKGPILFHYDQNW